jgi:hypothetical protein
MKPDKFDVVIVDMDPLIYRAGFSVEKINKDMDIIEIEPLQNAIYNLDSMMKKMRREISTTIAGIPFLTYLTASGDPTNFRFEVFPNYKENRKTARRPIYYTELRDRAIEYWGATFVTGQEADDTCAIAQIANHYQGRNSIICSIDKDFKNVAGWHYNYVTGRFIYIDEIQALRNKYLQILGGDTSDGIPRIVKGWRQKKVEKALEKALTEPEMYEIIKTEITRLSTEQQEIVWINPDKNEHKEIVSRGRLVHLRHYEGELWEPSHLKKN